MKPGTEASDSDDDGDLVENGASAVTVEDIEALKCSLCHRPLEPPIYQCIQGHVVCSLCRYEQAPGNRKCQACVASSTGRYLRCSAMDRLVESVRVPCPHAAAGCAARMPLYDRRSHRRACPYAPRGCPVKGCAFAGAAGALLDHLAGAHFQLGAVREFWAGELGGAMAKLKAGVEADEAAAEAGISPGDIEIVRLQASVSREVAIKVIMENDGDIVSAIMELTS